MINISGTSSFQQVIEAVESMPLEEREILLDILQKRLSASRRSQLVQEVAEVRRDYAEGKVKFGSVDDFLAALDD
jgi:glycerol kinase